MGTMKNLVKRQSLSDEAISNFIDPRTGQRLRPLGVVGGKTVWPMMGASEDDDSSEDDEEETEDKEKGSESTDSSEGGSGSDKGDPQAKITALEAEKNRHVRRRQEAETALSELKARLEELEGKDKPELERITARATELESEVKTLQGTLRDARLENAFLSDNSYTWHNPGRALALADLSDVEIDSDGTVHGLKEALAALAKSDSYLLKKEESKDDDDKELPNTDRQKNKSKKDKNKSDADDAALRSKYPALRR